MLETEASENQDQPNLFTEYLSLKKPQRVNAKQRPLGRYIYPPNLGQRTPNEHGQGATGNKNSNHGIKKSTNTTLIPNFGLMSTFKSNPDDWENDTGRRAFLLVKTFAGEHESVGLQEGLLDIIGKLSGSKEQL